MNLKELITKGSETQEFKKSLSEWKEIVETVSAFSNTKGGTIVVGISNNGKIHGVSIGKNTIEVGCTPAPLSRNVVYIT